MNAPTEKSTPLMRWLCDHFSSKRGPVAVVLFTVIKWIFIIENDFQDWRQNVINTFCIRPPSASQCKVGRSPRWKGPCTAPIPPPSSSWSCGGPGGTDKHDDFLSKSWHWFNVRMVTNYLERHPVVRCGCRLVVNSTPDIDDVSCFQKKLLRSNFYSAPSTSQCFFFEGV